MTVNKQNRKKKKKKGERSETRPFPGKKNKTAEAAAT